MIIAVKEKDSINNQLYGIIILRFLCNQGGMWSCIVMLESNTGILVVEKMV